MDRALQARLEQDPLLRAATEWFVELRSNEVSVERIGEWQQWLAADAANKHAFERVESLWSMGSQAVTTRWPTDAEVDEDAYDGEASISEWRHQSRLRQSNRFLLTLAAGVTVMMVALSWIAWARWPQLQASLLGNPGITLSTAVGETRTLPLPDGSTVAVGGNTLLTATFGSNFRNVTLERGEAFFHVAKDNGRAFTVHAGGTAITAIGTAFNVRMAGQRIVVAVSEGSVRVAAPVSASSHAASKAPEAQLKAGQQLSVEPTGNALQVSPVDTSTVAGWRQGRLQYLNEPLETVVADLARYSTRDIRIADAEVADLRVTGIVFEQNIDGWLASLQATFPVQVLRDTSGGVTLMNQAR